MANTIHGVATPAPISAPGPLTRGVPTGRYRIVDPLDIPATAPAIDIRAAILESVRVARLDRASVGARLDEIELLARAIRGKR